MAQAVERAKQVTMTELNAIIGVRGLPNLPLTVCIPPLLSSFDLRPGAKLHVKRRTGTPTYNTSMLHYAYRFILSSYASASVAC